MARPKKKKEDKELVVIAAPIENKIVVEAPEIKTTKEIQQALLLNYSKVTLKSRGLI